MSGSIETLCEDTCKGSSNPYSREMLIQYDIEKLSSGSSVVEATRTLVLANQSYVELSQSCQQQRAARALKEDVCVNGRK